MLRLFLFSALIIASMHIFRDPMVFMITWVAVGFLAGLPYLSVSTGQTRADEFVEVYTKSQNMKILDGPRYSFLRFWILGFDHRICYLVTDSDGRSFTLYVGSTIFGLLAGMKITLVELEDETVVGARPSVLKDELETDDP